MFTIEHQFDRTVVTVIDEGPPRGSPGTGACTGLCEDVVIALCDDHVTVSQYDPGQDRVQSVTLSMSQLRDIAAALHLPEGSYRLPRGGRGGSAAPDGSAEGG